MKKVALILLVTILYGCGKGLDKTLPASSDAKYHEALIEAFKDMTTEQQETFNSYAGKMTVSEIGAAYENPTPRKIIEGEANKIIKSQTDFQDKVQKDFPEILKIFSAQMLSIEEKSISILDSTQKEQGRVLVKYTIKNKSPYTLMCKDMRLDNNEELGVFAGVTTMFLEAFGESYGPWGVEVSIFANDNQGITVSRKPSGQANLCNSLPKPGKVVNYSSEFELGDTGGNLLTAESLKRIGLKSWTLNISEDVIPANSSVPTKVLQKYTLSLKSSISAKDDLKVLK